MRQGREKKKRRKNVRKYTIRKKLEQHGTNKRYVSFEREKERERERERERDL